MARFVFYIVNLEDGTVKGSNNVEAIDSLVEDDNWLIIHKDSGTFFCGSRDSQEIPEMPSGVEEEEGEDDVG